MKGILYLVPNTLGNPDTACTIPEGVRGKVREIRVFIVENLRNARRYLKVLDRAIEIDRLVFHELNEHTPPEMVPTFLRELLAGSDTGVITDAGVPGVADPGAAVVRLAHEQGIRVVPLTGPSSILLSLMASGLNGQEFRFHGYLPIHKTDRKRKIREIETELKGTGETQIFMEAPYRNEQLLSDLLEVCDPATLLCISADITLGPEYIRTLPVGRWKQHRPALHKRPALFLLGK
jgi:16S rRNA (cytidine1402-2'-O)-methyltransferase